MKNIFYFIGMIVALRNLFKFLAPKEYAKKVLEMHETNKLYKGRTKEIPEDIAKQYIPVLIFAILGLTFMFGGLFTFQWPFFFAFIIFDFGISGAILDRVLRNTKIFPIWLAINSFICFVVIIFLIINAYHLHIDPMQLYSGLRN